MPTKKMETDYLVIGAGARGLAFTEALIEASDAQIVIVDRRHAPGGHWNEAYPFVRLHMPSSFYGVNALPLGNDIIDRDGSNRGLYERASGHEICTYYDRFMREHLLPSGRVRYFPMCDYRGDRHFVSRVSGDAYEVKVRRSVVEAAYLSPSVPSSCKPPFEIAPGARCVPVGALAEQGNATDGYVIIGSGKTAMDACVWLLDLGVPPEDIRWIKPREPWVTNRAYLQGGKLVGRTFEGFALTMEVGAQVESLDEFFAHLATDNWLLRVDENVAPTMFKGAMSTVAEIEQLRHIKDVVRLGHVRRLDRDTIFLEGGKVPTSSKHLHVHCAASGLNQAPALPIFAGDRILLQEIRFGRTCFNGSIAGFIEATRQDQAEKNRLCPAARLFDVPHDLPLWLIRDWTLAAMWSKIPDVHGWQKNIRLDLAHDAAQHADDPRLRAARKRIMNNVMPAITNLEKLLTQAA